MAKTEAPWMRSFIADLWNKSFEPTVFSHQLLQYGVEKALSEKDYNELALELMRVATLTNSPDEKAFHCLKLLVHSQLISWPSFLERITQFTKFGKTRCVFMLTSCLNEVLLQIRCSKVEDAECMLLSDAVCALFSWLVEGICQCIRDVDLIDGFDPLADTLLLYAHDPFHSSLMRLRSASFSADRRRVLDPLLHLLEEDPRSAKLDNLKIIAAQLESLFEPFTYVPAKHMHNFMNESSSAMRTIGAVFACFRILATVPEVVATVRMMASTLCVPIKTMVHDVVYTCLLTHLEQVPGKSSFVDMFLFLKLPRILEAIKAEMNWPTAEMERILHAVLQNARHVLDALALEQSMKDQNQSSSLRVFLDQLHLAHVVSKEFCNHVITTRQGLHGMRHDEQQQNLTLKALTAKNSLGKIWSNERNHTKFLSTQTASLLVSSGGLTFDHLCSVFCLEGNVVDLSNKFASMNMLAERPSPPSTILPNPESRAEAFDTTFSQLYRMTHTFVNVSIEELVKGRKMDEEMLQGVYYKWAKTFVRRIGQPFVSRTALTHEEKERHREKINYLRDNGLFWDPVTVNYADVIWTMPVVGEVILDGFKEKRQHVDQDLQSIVSRTLCTFSFVVLCLVQWLDTQPDSDAKVTMARTIRMAIEDTANRSNEKSRALYIRNTCRHILDEMSAGSPIAESFAITVVVMADRKLPAMRTNQVPERELLKRGWFFSQRQNWCSPPVLDMLDHCNRAGMHKLWVEVFMHNMLKNRTVDELQSTGQMILSAALLDPARSLLALCQCLVDYLIEPLELGRVRYEPPHALPLAQLVANVLIMSEWTLLEGRRHSEESDRVYKNEGPDTKRRREENPLSTAPTMPFPDSEKLVLVELEETVDVAINKLCKKVREGLLSPVISFISLFLVQLADQRPSEGAPHETAWTALVRRVPLSLLQNLSVLEPNSVSLPLFALFCDANGTESTAEKLQFACAARGYGVI